MGTIEDTRFATTASAVAPPADGLPSPPQAYLDRLQANLALAEQTLKAVRELESGAGASLPRPTRTRALTASVVIPVYNERETIVEIVRRVQAVGVHREIIIVDDFSTDGTRDLLLQLDREPDVRVLLHGYNRGKGAALRTAFPHCRGDVVVIQDADLEYDPADLPALISAIEDGEADVVYGSRFLENPAQDPSRVHRLGNWLLTVASNLTTGQWLTDMETCYKAFRRDVLAQIDVEQERFGFEPEITAKVSQLGYGILEMPIRYSSRGYSAGKKIGMRDAVSALWCIAKYGWLRAPR
ncbi:MAG TPA: glycosyltransferase family 2 protein [Lacipirellulaceae bacterium]|nr:glycosyltransferase family 2 protein [Lacipirellulaceae bacterium]HMP06629.1 glycosyltransferase family 2 protein [Lacipirellulaceae bacterium]